MPLARSHLWLPFTQMRDFDSRNRTFVRASGTMLEDATGHRVYDAISSIWTTIHGHCHPRIVEAIARQAARLDHATLLGATNPVAEELARRLCAVAKMDRAFFASDGASAVEAAIKIALQYWQNSGRPDRTRFIRLSRAYHGDTTGAMSLSAIAAFKARFKTITFETRVLGNAPEWEDDVAAIIVEPLIQAAAGMRLVPPHAYTTLKNTEALVICDEIATGFGRTTTMFAYEQTGVRPDIICVGKGLTGGTLALSATLVREKIYEAFLGEPEALMHFLHGHSYAGNPIAAAAAGASLALFEEEKTLERATGIAKAAAARLEGLRSHPRVAQTRQAGTMIGVELLPGHSGRVVSNLYDAGHFTRPIGDTVQLVPPLASTDAEINAFFDALAACL